MKSWIRLSDLKAAADVMGFELSQCCCAGYEIEGVPIYYNIYEAVKNKDVVCTDSLPKSVISDFTACQVTKKAMELANEGAVLNPCPPFYREEEISADVINSSFFVGYEFKKCLLNVQQAIMLYCLTYK